MKKELIENIKGVVFDFNGTLFQDNDINEITWRQFIKERYGRDVSDDEFKRYFHGVNNKDTLEIFEGRKLTYEEARELGENGKEVIYREYILDHPDRQILTPGAENFFDYLKDNNIPFTIATASCLKNVKFFFDIFDLDRWFDLDQVVYDNGKLASKPNPELYLKAFEKIGIPPEDGIVFEDAISGIEAANNAGTGVVAAVDLTGKNHFEERNDLDAIITTFDFE